MTTSFHVSGRLRFQEGGIARRVTVELWDAMGELPNLEVSYERIGTVPELVRRQFCDAPIAVTETDERGEFDVQLPEQTELPDRYHVRVFDGRTFLGSQKLSSSDAAGEDNGQGSDGGDWLDVVISGKGAAAGLAGIGAWYVWWRDDDDDGGEPTIIEADTDDSEGEANGDEEEGDQDDGEKDEQGEDDEDDPEDDGSDESEPAEFRITKVEYEESVDPDSWIDFFVEVTNDGGELEVTNVLFEFDGEVIDDADIELAAGESAEKTFELHATEYDDGEYPFEVATEDDSFVSTIEIGPGPDEGDQDDEDGDEEEDEPYSPRDAAAEDFSTGGRPSFSPEVDDQAKALASSERQEGVDEDELVDRRLSVYQGRVHDRDGDPIPDVKVRVKDHAEFGMTRTDADGEYRLAVNGGQYYAFEYQKEGYLPIQRRRRVDVRDYDSPGDVVLVGREENEPTKITMGVDEYQVVSGPREEDKDGTRSSLLIIPPGTEGEGGADELTFHAVEYTVGDRGQEAMPARLPTRTGYTYATEYLATATDVERPFMDTDTTTFTQPVIHYSDNFIGFPVGDPVPTGLFERDDAQWTPTNDGIVLAIVGVEDGVAALDIDGDGSSNDTADLEELGITLGEREQLAAAYDPGTELWRSEIPHFTPFDCNWPTAPPEGANEVPDVDEPEDPCE